MNLSRTIAAAVAGLVLGLMASSAIAGEVEIGKPVNKHGMEIVAVYLHAVTMESRMPMEGGPVDIHLEADIHALKNNPYGFAEGAWIPYLAIGYRLAKQGSDWSTTGTFIPMVANDGPHYGANVKLAGPGKYRLTYRVSPPTANGFFRHTDTETGIPKWWPPFELRWTFTYIGTGKKGTY